MMRRLKFQFKDHFSDVITLCESTAQVFGAWHIAFDGESDAPEIIQQIWAHLEGWA